MALDGSPPIPSNQPWFRSWADSTIVATMGSRILVADDEPHIRAVVRAYLEREGYDALGIGNGEMGMRAIIEYAPEMVLLDLSLPGIDGFEVARRLKADFATHHIPIVFMTGLPETEHVVAAFAAESENKTCATDLPCDA